ncbi:hypothetical protein [Streptosporangium sp. CA-115845]|uniref:hypothetical protein n=1 Tax=Streptosporangium sp. CA-115845 TaxID=3240071 RepID=UPI003D92B363
MAESSSIEPREPDTADEVRHALKAPTRGWASPSLLSFPAAAAELLVWLGDARNFDPNYHPPALASAISDYDRSVKSGFGEKIKIALQGDLAAFETSLTPLRNDPSKNRTPVETALNTLIHRLKSPDVLQAAWLDLWSKCGRDNSPPEAIAIRRDLFLALARLAEHDIEQLICDLAGLLDNDAPTVYRARLALGDISVPDSSGTDPQVWELAELNAGQRCELVGRFLALPPSASQHVVWLAYERAALYLRGVETIGNMVFFDSEIVPREPDEVTAKFGMHGERWTDKDGKLMARMPHAKGVVLVRVSLPADTYIDPVKAARDQVEALVTLGKFKAGVYDERIWRLLPGASHISPVQVRWQLISPSSDAASQRNDRQQQASVYVAMADWAQAHGKIRITEPRLAEAVELLGRWRDTQAGSALGRVTANVQVIETAASRVGTAPWNQHLGAYMKTAWLEYQTRTHLSGTIFDAIGGDLSELPLTAWEELRAIQNRTVKFTDLRLMELLPNSTQQALHDLKDLYPSHHQLGRRLRTLDKRLSNSASFATWLTQLGNEWEHQLDRLLRIRNAVTHGGPATTDAVNSIDLFSSYLAMWEVEIFLESALAGTDLVTAHDDFHTKNTSRLDVLRTAAQPGDHLHM